MISEPLTYPKAEYQPIKAQCESYTPGLEAAVAAITLTADGWRWAGVKSTRARLSGRSKDGGS
jgi:hypothetical protein